MSFEDAYADEPQAVRWPLDWRGLYPRERWLWFERLWIDVCMLRDRYRLAVRSGWWRDAVQLEALSALAAWVERYDAGEWDDLRASLRCSATWSASMRCYEMEASRFTTIATARVPRVPGRARLSAAARPHATGRPIGMMRGITPHTRPRSSRDGIDPAGRKAPPAAPRCGPHPPLRSRVGAPSPAAAGTRSRQHERL